MVSEETVRSALRNCYDPCCQDRGISVVDMGLIEAIHIEGEEVRIEMLLTTGWCPFVANLNSIIEEELIRIPGVERVSVEVVWDPVWTMERLSPSAREKLTLDLAPLIPYRERRLAAEQGGRSDRQ